MIYEWIYSYIVYNTALRKVTLPTHYTFTVPQIDLKIESILMNSLLLINLTNA